MQAIQSCMKDGVLVGFNSKDSVKLNANVFYLKWSTELCNTSVNQSVTAAADGDRLCKTFSYPCHICLKAIVQTNKNILSFVTNIIYSLLLLFQTHMTCFEYIQSNFKDFWQCFLEGEWGQRLSVTNILHDCCYTKERKFCKTLQWGCIKSIS